MQDYINNAQGIACGVMNWTPETFWQATPFDFFAAWQGFQMFHGLKATNDLTPDDVHDLRALLDTQIQGSHVL